jgi:hypothetical protein
MTGLIFACMFFAPIFSSAAQQTGKAQQSSVQDQYWKFLSRRQYQSPET